MSRRGKRTVVPETLGHLVHREQLVGHARFSFRSGAGAREAASHASPRVRPVPAKTQCARTSVVSSSAVGRRPGRRGHGGLGASPFGAGVAEGAEGGGVAAGLGGEVAAEAEHVGPGAQAEVFEVLAGAEGPGGADEPAGVVGDVELAAEFGERLDAAGRGCRSRLGALGGVLGDVGGDGRSVSSWPPSKSAERMGRTSSWRAEGEGVGASVDDRAGRP